MFLAEDTDSINSKVDFLSPSRGCRVGGGGCGVGGGERRSVGVALIRYRDRDLFVGRLFVSLFCPAVSNLNFA